MEITSSLSPGAIAGIVIACMAFAAVSLTICIVCCFCRKRRSSYAHNAVDLEAGLNEGPGILPVSSHAHDQTDWTNSSSAVEGKDAQEEGQRRKRGKGIRIKGKGKGFFGLGAGIKEDDLKPSQHFAAPEDIEMHQISTVKGARQVAPPSRMIVGGGEAEDYDIQSSPSHPTSPQESKGKSMLQRWLDTLPISSDDQPPNTTTIAAQPLIPIDAQRSAPAPSFTPSPPTLSLTHLFKKLTSGSSNARGISFHQLPPSRPQSLVAPSSIVEGSVMTSRSRVYAAGARPVPPRAHDHDDGTVDEITTDLSSDPRATPSSGVRGGVAFSRIESSRLPPPLAPLLPPPSSKCPSERGSILSATSRGGKDPL